MVKRFEASSLNHLHFTGYLHDSIMEFIFKGLGNLSKSILTLTIINMTVTFLLAIYFAYMHFNIPRKHTIYPTSWFKTEIQT